jgi:endo-1,4-beta-xylanase
MKPGLKLLFGFLLFCVTASAVVFASGTSAARGATTLAQPSLSVLITSKTGPSSARVWTMMLSNNGPGTANSTQLNSFTLTQTAGAACTPIVTPPSSYPIMLGNIAPGHSVFAAFTVDFTGCSHFARFNVRSTFSANSGAVTGSKTLYNQFQ